MRMTSEGQLRSRSVDHLVRRPARRQHLGPAEGWSATEDRIWRVDQWARSRGERKAVCADIVILLADFYAVCKCLRGFGISRQDS